MSVFTLTGALDNFTGNAGETNTVFFTPENLQAGDIITGGATGSFFDILTITAGGALLATQFGGTTNFELLTLSSAGNSVALSNGLVGGSSTGIFAVLGDAGDDTVNATGVTNGMRIAFYAGSGNDSFFGGNGNDYVEFAVGDLTAADTVSGGNGFDYLAFSTGGAISAAALANVSGIEQLILNNAGNSVTLSNAFVAGADNSVMSIADGTGNDTIDASGITNGIRVAFYASSGNETFIGGNGSDYLAFAANQLTSADTIIGGANYDIIELVTAGTVSADGFANVTGIDSLILNNGGSNVTLTNGLVAGSDNGVFVVLDGAGNDTVNASAVVANRVVFAASTGNDSFTGGGGSDVALFSAAGLNGSDAFIGGAGFDVLQLTTAGTVGAAAFTNFSGVDELFLTLSGNNITLSGGLVASSDNGVFVVYDQAGHNTVDASAATLGGRVVFMAVAGDHNTYTGGTGTDFFMFGAGNLNATNTLIGGGGAGVDFLTITTAGSVSAADLANVSQMEVVQLQAGGSVALANNLSNTGSLEAQGTAAVDTIDGSAVTSYDIVIKGGGGADTLKGGAGNDQIFLPDTNFVAIDGNGGFDKIVLTSAFDGQTFDLSAQVSKITNVEVITLESAANAILKIAPGDIAQINSGTNLLYVVAGSDDQIVVSGTGWTVVATNHTNPALPGHVFTHYHNTNGSDLYVDGTAPIDIQGLGALSAITDNATAVEDVTGASGSLIANDTYTGAGTLSISAVTGAIDGGATFTVDGTYGRLVVTKASGAYAYTLGVTGAQQAATQQLGTGANPTESFGYTVTDGNLTASANLIVSVFGINDAPTATVEVVPNAIEDTAYNFDVATLFTDIDSVPSADTLTYSVTGLPAGLSFAGSTISGTPTNSDVGSYSISVTATDGHGGSLTRAFTLSVANTNDAPVAVDDTVTTAEDTPVTFNPLANDSDVDGGALSVTGVTVVSGGGTAVVNGDGTITYTPASNAFGPVELSYDVWDGTATASATVTITVTPVNDAPVIAPIGLQTIDEDEQVLATVAEVEAIIAAAISDVDGDEQTVTLTVKNGATVLYTYTYTPGGPNADFDFTPPLNFNGNLSVEVTTDDGQGAPNSVATRSFTLVVAPVNDAPVAVDDTVITAEDTPVTFNPLANDSDVDGDALSVTGVTVVSGGGTAVVNGDGTITYTPASNAFGPVELSYDVWDGTATASASVTITVTPVNDAPVIAPIGLQTIDEDEQVLATVAEVEAIIAAAISDVDGDEQTVTLTVKNGAATLYTYTYTPGGPNADFDFTPPLNFNGNLSVEVTTDDGQGAPNSVATRSFTLVVAPVNDAPVAVDDTVITAEDTPVTFNPLANDSDVDGDALSVTGVTVVSGGGTAVVNGDGTITYTPASNAFGPVELSYDVWDGTATASATVTITVTPVNDAPVIAPIGLQTIDEDEQVLATVAEVEAIIAAAISDVDGDEQTVTLTVKNGATVLYTYTYTPGGPNADFDFTPPLNFNGNLSVEVTTDDGQGAPNSVATRSFTLVVAPVNDAPVAVDDTVITAEDTPVTFNPLANDSDVDGDALSVTGVTVVSGGGTAVVNGDGTITYTPASNAFGPVELSYDVWDGTATASATVTITVTPVNDAPVAVSDSLAAVQDGEALLGNILANDSDVEDGAPMPGTVTAFTVAGVGAGTVGEPLALGNGAFLTVDANGNVTLTQNDAYDWLGTGETATISLSYTVTDADNASDTASAVITVTGVNGTPVLSLGSPLPDLETASSSPLGTAIAAATASIVDEENKIQKIEVDISGGYQDGTATTLERAQLNALGDFALSLFGGSANFVDAGNHGTLTLTFPTPITGAQAALVLRQIDYINQYGNFDLAIALDDTRTIAVRVQDHNGAWSNTVTHDVSIAADVVDDAGDGTFVGGRFNDTINGAGGDDTLTGGKGNDTLIGGDNTAAGDTVDYAKELDAGEVSETGTHGVVVNLSDSAYDLDGVDAIYDPTNATDNPSIGAGQATDTYGDTDTLSGIENVVGTVYDDIIVDAALVSNVYSGGETAEVSGDTVVFRGTLGPSTPGEPYFRVQATGVEGDDFIVEYFDPVNDIVLATDTLTDIENLVFDNDALNIDRPVWVFEDGFLVGTFTSVEAAIETLANNLTGDVVVEIGHGTTPPSIYSEGEISVTRAMTITSIGTSPTVEGQFTVSGTLDGEFKLEKVTVDATGHDYGVYVTANSTGFLGSVSLDLVAIENAQQNGFAYIRAGNGSTPTLTDTVGDISITNSSFSGNATVDAGSNGRGDIILFGYNKNLTIDEVTIGSPGAFAQKAIQMRGVQDGGDTVGVGPFDPAGNVSITNVTITGAYATDIIAFYRIAEFNSFTGSGNNVDVTRSPSASNNATLEPWALINFDSVGGEIDLTGFFSSASNMASPDGGPAVPWWIAQQQGLASVDTFTGTQGIDLLVGRGGDDVIDGAGGNDTIVYNVGNGRDTVDGGADDDVLIVNGTAASETFNVNDVDGGTKLGINITNGVELADENNAEVITQNVEDIVINTGNGGDTVIISGDLGGTGVDVNTITVNGGTGADTVDTTSLSSAHGIVFNGGAGNDTFLSSDAGGADTFAGGDDVDTVNYSAVTGGGVNVNLGSGTATDIGGTGVGNDTLVDVENVIGTAQDDVLIGSSAANVLMGNGGNDTLIGGGGADTLVGGADTDTADYGAIVSADALFGVDIDGHWTITIDGVTDTLIGVERVTFGDRTYLLVDKEGTNVGGYQTVQSAINAAAGGETILIRGGEVYSEQSDYIGNANVANFGGLYINKPNLTLQGTDAEGIFITAAASAQSGGPTVVSAFQNQFGANHWVDVNGDNTTFSGVHLKAGPETNNKVLELWADNVTVQNSFIDSYMTSGMTEVYTFAVAIYINDNGSAATDEVTSYTIDGNILNEGIVVANGVGDPSLGISTNQKITNNHFIDTFDYGNGLGRYDTIVINGEVNGVGWLLEPTQTPTITGNTIANNTVPFILRGSDNNPANLPSAAQIAVILANNFSPDMTYAYVVDDNGDLVLASRDDGGGPYFSFAVTNTIDTLNLALDTETYFDVGTSDQVFPDQRIYMKAGDTIVVQSGATGTVNSQIMVDDLKVQATANSLDLNLTLATTLADGTPIAGGGVTTVTLTDYNPGLGQGANVDVTGNALDNTITGNSGDNRLDGGEGNDTLHGGGGNDVLIGGTQTMGGADTATYDDARSNYDVTMHDDDSDGFIDRFSAIEETGAPGLVDEGSDTLDGIERLVFDNGATVYDLTQPIQVFDESDQLVGTFSTIQAAVNAADAGYTVLVNGAIQSTFTENVTMSDGITIKGLGSVTLNGSILVDGGAGGSLTIDNIDVSGTAQNLIEISANAVYSSITFKNGNVTGGAYTGFFLNNATGVSSVTIDTAVFSGAAPTDTLSAGESEISFYKYNGNVTLKDVTVSGPGAVTGLENGIQFVGNDTPAPIGTVTFENVSVTGTYAKTGIAIYNFANLDGIALAGTGLTVNVTAAWAGLNLDDIGGTVDLSSKPLLSVSNASAGVVPGAFDIDLQGTGGSQTFIGNDADNFFTGKGANDTLVGGAGDDVFLEVAGDGADTIDGNGDTFGDVLLVAGQGGFAAANVNANETVNVKVNGAGVITGIDGGTVTNIEFAALDMDGGIDTLSYAGNTDAVAVDLGAGTATGFTGVPVFIPVAVQGVENVIGGSNNDTLTGDAGANVLMGGDGSDVLRGAGGDDTLYGGNETSDVSQTDQANYSGTLSTYQVSFDPFQTLDGDGLDATVAGGADGNDTLHGVELLNFDGGVTLDLTAKVFLFNSSNHLIGTFDTIQDAVDAAALSGGINETIRIRDGEYVEQVVIDGIAGSLDGLTLIGQSEAGVVIHAPTSGLATYATDPISGRALFSVVTVSGADDITIQNLSIDGDEQAGQVIGGGDFNGIAYVNASGRVEDVTVDEIRDLLVTPTQVSGNQRGNAILVTNTIGSPKEFELISTNLMGFQKTGAVIRNATATVTGNTVTGFGVQPGALGGIAQNGIQLSSGSTGSVTGNHLSAFGLSGNIATVVAILVFDTSGVVITGNDYTGTGVFDAGVYLQNVSGSTIADNDFIGARRGVSENGAMPVQNNVVNTGATANTYTGIGTFNHDLNAAAAETAVFTPVGSEGADRYRTGAGADTLDGGAGDDYLEGRGGTDTMLGGDGNDTIVYTAGDGTDAMIDGGEDTDTLAIFGTAGNDTINVVVAGGAVTRLASNGSGLPGTDNVAGMETVELDLSGGGIDTLDYTGTTQTVTVNLGANTATGFTTVTGDIENVTGGSGNDVLTGSSGNNVIVGGGGDDIIVGGGGNDTLQGGEGDDNFIYSLGDGQDTVDGGEGNEDDGGDVLTVNGDADPQTFNINPISGGYLGINIEAGTGNVVAADDTNYEVRTIDVEEIVINAGGGADTIIISGDLGGTGVSTSTVTVNGGDGNDTIDASGITGAPVRVVLDGGAGADVLRGGAGDDMFSGGTGSVVGVGSGNYTGDRVEYAGSRLDYTITKNPDGSYQIVGPTSGTDTLTGVEGVRFAATPTIIFELDSNSTNLAASTLRYDQSFATDTAGFAGSGATTRQVDGGWNGVESSDGDGHFAVVTQTGSGPSTVFDGYRADFGGGYVTKVDIYLDPALILAGQGFDVSTAASRANGTHLRDFFFHVTHDNTPLPSTAPTKLLVGGSNTTGASDDPRQDLDTINHVEITGAGWYTFEWKFYEGENGALEVAMNLYDKDGNWLFTEVRNDGTDLIDTIAGGNRYMWFTNVDVPGGIAIDNVQLYTVDDNPIQLVKGAGSQLGVVNPNTILASYANIGDALIAALPGNIVDLAAKDYTGESPVTVDVDNLTFRGPAGAVGVDLELGAANTVTLAGSAPIGVQGNASANVITGNLGANVLEGMGGNDTLQGGGGNDLLDGGNDIDTAVYSDGLANYTVSYVFDGNGFVTGFSSIDETTVIGIDEGVDTLISIERLRFQNGTPGNAGDDTVLDLNDAVQLFDALNKLIGTFGNLKSAVDFANADVGSEFTIRIAAGDVDIGGSQVVINKNITIDGAGMSDTTLVADFNTGNAGDARGLILVNPGKTLNVSDLTIDGDGHLIWQAIRHLGSGDIDRVHFEDIQYQVSGSPYAGTAIAAFGGAGTNVDVTDSVFTNIGRIGIQYFGAGTTGTASGNTYTGKGAGDWLDYAIEVGGGASAQILDNTVTGNLGIATFDGSGSAAFLVTTALGSGTEATFGDNTVTGSSVGVAAGFNATDTSDVTFLTGNDFTSGVGTGVVVRGNVEAQDTNLVDGTFSWFGGPANNAPSGAGLADVLRGGDGFDAITGFGGNDTIQGGEGGESYTGATGEGDKALYTTVLTADKITAVGGGWQVDATAGDEGTDTLTGIEIVDGNNGSGNRFLLVGNGGFDSIRKALDEAVSGDTILVAAGTYTGNITISVNNLTILSMDGAGTTHIVGDVGDPGNATVTIASGVTGLTLGGLGKGFHIVGFDRGNPGIENAAVYLLGNNENVTIQGNNIEANGDLGLLSNFGVSLENILIDSNEFSGKTFVGAAPASGDQFVVNNVARQLVAIGTNSDGLQGSLPVEQITFTNNLVSGQTGTLALGNQLVTIDARNSLVEGNTFTGLTSSASFALRVRGRDVDVIGNTVDHSTGGNSGGIFIDDKGVPGTYSGNKLVGGNNADTVQMTPGADVMNGADGADVLYGGAGADTINGGAGDDVFIIASPSEYVLGEETINGGLDNDTIRFVSTTAGQTLVLDAGVTDVEEIEISDAFGANTGTTALNVDASAVGGTYTLTGNDGDNVLTAGAGSNTLDGLDGNDTLDGGAGSDIVNGGAGDDRIVGTLDGVADTYNGGTHNPVNALTGTGGDTIDYSATTDGISVTLVSGAATVIDNEAGNDSLSGIENIIGGGGADLLTGDAFDNILVGNGGNDSLSGGDGNDRLVGGAGADNLTGGTGADTFVYEHRSDGAVAGAASGQDTIFGFSTAEGDRFVFTHSGANDFFAGISLPDDFIEAGHVKSNYFHSTNVTGTSYGGGSGKPLFVLDSVSPGFAGTLWFDAEGNNDLSGPNDVKIADLANDSVLFGFGHTQLWII